MIYFYILAGFVQKMIMSSIKKTIPRPVRSEYSSCRVIGRVELFTFKADINGRL